MGLSDREMKLDINHLVKKFNSLTAVNDFSASFDKGCYGILGKNGSGKTTIFRCITGFYSYKGEIKKKRNISIGYLPQKSGVLNGLTVYENMEFFAELRKYPNENRQNAIIESLKYVNMEENTKLKGKALSGGMKRRLGIAETILGNPEIILFDEPTIGLDPEERLRFKKLIRRLKENSVVIISTHIIEDVEAVADKVIVIDEGMKLFSGTVDELEKRASGKVFEISSSDVQDVDYVVKEYERDGRIISRILTNRIVKDNYKADENIEDGYLCCIKRI